ncbi:hypothetical protein PRIPAC_95416, partial [Pristionchus pacificus]|uniref:Uncharacterized protein n=1 Tax=Pristionchus pacificus TaxID=54126 RepID=A0A2A6BC74_PRIPA
PSDNSPGNGNYNTEDYKGFFIAMMILIGLAAAMILYCFQLYCCDSDTNDSTEDEPENIEMCLCKDGSAVTARLASDMAVQEESGSNSVSAKASIISRSSNVVYV